MVKKIMSITYESGELRTGQNAPRLAAFCVFSPVPPLPGQARAHFMRYGEFMEVLREIHRFALPIPIVGHHLVLLSAILFVWSLVFFVRGVASSGFITLLRVTWAAFAVNTLAGIGLALLGLRVPSSVPSAPGSNVTALGFPVDPVRHWEHLMYAFFFFASLYVMEVLIAGKAVKPPLGLRFLPLVTIFLLGVAYMSVRVAYLPGATPGS